MKSNEAIIRNFIADWSSLSVDKIVNYFTQDGVYHNMMSPPVAGHENLRRFISGFIKNWTRTDWVIINILSADDIVVAERIDRTSIGERTIELPCCGVFEIQEGKIKIWRDYFDLATYSRNLRAHP